MTELDETDAAIVHALQIAPRASWTAIARALRIDPATAARRWRRLVEAGLAWVTAYPTVEGHGVVCVGFIEVDCAPDQRDALVCAWAADPRIASIEVVGSGRDLLLTVVVADFSAMSALVLDELQLAEGVRRLRLHMPTEFHGEANRWRFGALEPGQQRDLTVTARPGRRMSYITREARTLIMALADDGRRSATELAERTGMSPSTVTRRIQALSQGGVLSLRCEVSHRFGGWPVIVNCWARSPVHLMDQVGDALTVNPAVRLCVGLTGETNVLFTVWLRTISELAALERALVARCSGLRLVDRAVTLRMCKRMGWRLDDQGRALDCVPIDPWARAAVIRDR